MKIYKVLLCALAAIFAACTSQKDGSERPTLVVSIEPQRYMLEQLVGSDFDIVVVMPSGDNPETFEPSMSKRMAVDNCAAYFAIGYLPFEHKLEATVRKDVNFVNTSEGIEPIYGTHSHHHGHEHGECAHAHDADPHVWTSVRNARTMCINMTDVLIELNPEKAAHYQSNCIDYVAHLDSLDRAFAKRLEAVESPFMMWHPSLSYFARDYGLEQLSVSADNKENSMQELRQVIDHARSEGVMVFFFQRDYDSRQAETICQSVGARLVEVNPGAYLWEDEFKKIVDELCKP